METASFRLPEDLVRQIDRVAHRRGMRKSAVVREALQRYLSEEGKKLTRIEILNQILGDHPGSGHHDYARRSEEILRARFRARRRSR